MIDIENYVYTQVRAALKEAFATIDTSAEYEETPAAFPHVCAEMTDNTNSVSYMTASKRENVSEVTFTVNIFTNTTTAKSDAKKIAQTVDSVMQGLGFRRSIYLRTPNIDRTIYRLTLRYTGFVYVAFDEAQGHYNITAR